MKDLSWKGNTIYLGKHNVGRVEVRTGRYVGVCLLPGSARVEDSDSEAVSVLRVESCIAEWLEGSRHGEG